MRDKLIGFVMVALLVLCGLDIWFFSYYIGQDALSLNIATMAGCIMLMMAIFGHSALCGTIKETLILFGVVVFISSLSEWSSMHYGFPFGETYKYNEDLLLISIYGLPLFVQIAWFALSYFSVIIVQQILAKRNLTPFALSLPCAGLLLFQDLYFEPISVYNKAWMWDKGGIYFNSPIMNLVGWFVTGFIMFLTYFLMVGTELPTKQAPKWADFAYVIGSFIMAFALTIRPGVSSGDWRVTAILLCTTAPVVVLWSFYRTQKS